MSSIRRVGLTMAIVVSAVLASGGATVRACSCASVAAVDAIAGSDVVFLGTAVDDVGEEFRPVWEFDVSGVVKGEVAATELVTGEDWQAGCGTDFGRFTTPIVVFATGRSGELQARGCMPTPDEATFTSLVESSQLESVPDDAGPPAIAVAGRIGAINFHLLDEKGVVVGAGELPIEPGAAAHCSGTPLAVVWSQGPSQVSDEDPDGPLIAGLANPVSFVDLATMEIIEERTIVSEFVSARDQMRCLDGGDRVVVARGFGPNEGRITVATSNADPALDVSLDDTVASRGIVHPTGYVWLLPARSGDPIRILSSDDLSEVDIGPAATLGPEVAATHGAFDDDGDRIAILVTVSGDDIEYDTGATHVATFDVENGLPASGSRTLVELPGGSTGAAKRIEWLDDTTLIVERETDRSKVLDIVGTDGALVSRTDLAWGWGTLPIGDRFLRATNGGVQSVGRDGTALDTGLVPSTEHSDRVLVLASLVDAPTFDAPVAVDDAFVIRPLDESTQPAADEPASAAGPATVDASGTRGPTGPLDTESPASVSWAPIIGFGVIVAVLLFGLRAIRNQRRSGSRKRFPPIG